MELYHDVHAIADRLANLLEWHDRLLHLRRRDIETAVLLRRWIERPDLHRGDPAFEQAFRQGVGPIHERIEILERSLALAKVRVGYGTDVLGAGIAIGRAGVVNSQLVAELSNQHRRYRL